MGLRQGERKPPEHQKKHRISLRYFITDTAVTYLSLHGFTYRWETDIRVAESWAATGKVKSGGSEASICVQVVVTLLKARAGVVLYGTAWISSQEMVGCGVDQLSRVRSEVWDRNPKE